MRKLLLTVLALALFAATPPPDARAAADPYFDAHPGASVSSTAAPVTFSAAATSVDIINAGATNTLYAKFNGDAASSSNGVPILPCSGLHFNFGSDGSGPASVSLVTSSSTTTAHVTAYFNQTNLGQTEHAIAIPVGVGVSGCGLSISSEHLTGNLTVDGTSLFTGVATFTAKPIFSSGTASTIALFDASKGLISNASITTGAIPKSVSSGASLAASSISDDATNVTITEPVIQNGSNGATRTCGWSAMENLTLNTGGTTTDTAGNLLPANALILAVVGRVTTTITAACTGWSLGDATTSARFTANDTTLTANETQVGQAQLFGVVSTTAAGPTQAAAAKVRVTCAGGNPGAGVIRIQVYACTTVAPTS